AVGAVSFVLEGALDELSLVSGTAAVCTGRALASGYSCLVTAAPGTNRVQVVLLRSIEGPPIEAGEGPVVTLRLQDSEPVCERGGMLDLTLLELNVGNAEGNPIDASAVNGQFTCGCESSTTTTEPVTTTTSSSTSTTEVPTTST